MKCHFLHSLFFPGNRDLQSEDLLNSSGSARSGLRPLTNIPYCCLFPTAASRRSLGRVSVPVWPSALSGRLCIIALVSRCLTNKLMHRRSIPRQSLAAFFNRRKMPPFCLWGLMLRFQSVSPCHGQVPCVLLTRSPLNKPCSFL